MKSKKTDYLVAKPAVLLEIGTDWLKIMQAEPAKNGISITRFHAEKFDALGGGLSRSIAAAYQNEGFRKSPVIMCLPRQLVTLRLLELPSTNPVEIHGMAEIQLAKQTPYSKEEIVHDYNIMKGTRPGYTRVMMAIVQNSVVRERYHILEEAGVEVGRVSVGTEGLYMWATETILGRGDTEGAGVLDIDSFFSDLVVIANGSIVASRSILVGANQLVGGSKERGDKFAKEVKRSLDACFSEAPGLTIRKLHVSGAGPYLRDLLPSLGAELGIPVEPVESLRNIGKLPPALTQLGSSLKEMSLTPLVGAAMGSGSLEINLLPDSLKLRKNLEIKARGLNRFAVLLMAFLISLSLFGMATLHGRMACFNIIRENVKKTEEPARKAAQKRKIVEMARLREDSSFSVINIMAQVHPRTPQSVALESFDVDIDRGQVGFAGSADSRADVSIFIKSLEQTPLLKDVKEDGATVKDADSGKLKFKITCSLER